MKTETRTFDSQQILWQNIFKMICDADAFAFGAQRVPKGFFQQVKQKPAGEKYVEYNVHCPRSGFACVEVIMS